MYVSVLFIYCCLFVQTIFANEDGEITRSLACEHETLVLSCPRGYTIDVLTALYGKENPMFCSPSGKGVTDCRAGTSLDLMKLKCNKKQTCAVVASNAVFGDPCAGTFKYLEVTYQCVGVDISSKIACEGEKLDIKCPDGEVLKVANALYGRNNPVVCNEGKLDIHHNVCQTGSALSVVESRCDNLNHCSVDASNEIFGDPCRGTRKYLEVDYQCLNNHDGGIHPDDSKPVDSKPVDSKPVDSEPVDSEPVDSKPVDSKPIGSNPVDYCTLC